MVVHAKDGIYPVDGKELGEEKKIGDGKVNFEKLIPRLKEVGYDKTLIIESHCKAHRQAWGYPLFSRRAHRNCEAYRSI